MAAIPAAIPTFRAQAASPRPSDEPGSYAELKRSIAAAGLLRAQPAYYTRKLLFTGALLCLSLGVLALARSSWLQLANAVFLAFVFTQIAFLAHDAGHRQIIRRGLAYEALSLTLGNVLLGISARWWTEKHNAHHSHPNQDDLDPDIDIPVIVFSPEQARAMHGVWRVVGAYQAYVLVPLLFVQSFSMRVMSVRLLLIEHSRRSLVELPLLAAQIAVYWWLLLQRLSVPEALGVFVLTQALLGVYLAAAFAPNHKGMPVLPSDSPLDFLQRQVLTARNVYGHPVTDFCFGGLNYQIEHHLFPIVPRNRLKDAQRIVRAFCAEHDIPYHETSLGNSYREVFAHLNAMSRIVRARD